MTSSQIQQKISIIYIYINKSGTTIGNLHQNAAAILHFIVMQELNMYLALGKLLPLYSFYLFIFFFPHMENVQRFDLKTTNPCGQIMILAREWSCIKLLAIVVLRAFILGYLNTLKAHGSQRFWLPMPLQNYTICRLVCHPIIHLF